MVTSGSTDQHLLNKNVPRNICVICSKMTHFLWQTDEHTDGRKVIPIFQPDLYAVPAKLITIPRYLLDQLIIRLRKTLSGMFQDQTATADIIGIWLTLTLSMFYFCGWGQGWEWGTCYVWVSVVYLHWRSSHYWLPEYQVTLKTSSLKM